MNILYLSADHGIPLNGYKGAAVHIRAMINAFNRAGHTITILTPRPGDQTREQLHATVVTVNVPTPQKPNGYEMSGESKAQAVIEPFVTHARNLLNNEHFDLIYERHSLWSNAGARLRQDTGLPLMLEVNAPLRLEAMRYRNLVDVGLAVDREAEQLSAADYLAVVSDQLAAYVIDNGARPEKVHVVPNAVDPQYFHPAVRGGKVRNRYGLHNRIVIGFAGRARPWHDLETLVRAFCELHAENPAYHLLLVGEMSDDVVRSAHTNGIGKAITITGPVPHTEVPEYLAAMDIAVCTNAPQSNFYFSPLKLFEYLACGVPAVAADIGQPAQLIREGQNGYLYPPGNAQALASAIRRLINDPAHAREIAWDGASEVLEKYTWDRNVEQLISWLKPNPAVNNLQTRASIKLPILDHKLRQRLYRATRLDLVFPFLEKQIRNYENNHHERIEKVIDISVLKYKPGRRCVLAYKLIVRNRRTGQSIPNQIIGKVFRDERGLRLLELQETLWRNGFGPEAADQIFVAQPLGYIHEMRMLVQEKVPGQTLNELVLKAPIEPFVIRCAKSLAKLHNSQAFETVGDNNRSLLNPYLLEDELRNLESYTENLIQFRPQSRNDILHLQENLFERARTLPVVKKPVPIHRDFYYSQVIFDGERLTLIDFDLLALGDPAIDVANFIAHLYFLGLDHFSNLNKLETEANRFLEEYARYRLIDESFMLRFGFYQTATFFRLLNVVTPRPALRHHFDTLFTRAEQSFLRGQVVPRLRYHNNFTLKPNLVY